MNSQLTRPLLLASGVVAISIITSGLVSGFLIRQSLENPAPKTVTEEGGEPPRAVLREESDVISTVEKTQNAVVSVIVAKDLPVMERYYEQENSPFGDFFDQFFGGNDPFRGMVPRLRENGTEKREIGGGTAFFVSSDGLLLTNRHVVDDTEAEYTVLLNDERKLEAKVVALDPGNDIAILKVEGKDFPFIALSADPVRLGQTTIAIGNALGEFRNTVSVGIVSGLQRSLDAGGYGGPSERLEQIIQTDAAINRGNSGGPLLNAHGEAIGMNTAVASSAQNIGFAIPATDLRLALDSYQKNGKIQKAFLGVRYLVITKEVQEKNSLAYDYGALVSRGEKSDDLAVMPGSPADKAGLQENDIILEVNGVQVTPEQSLASAIRHKAPGDTIHLKISRKGEEQELDVTLGEQE